METNNNPPEPLLFSPAEAARMLGVSERMVWLLIERGELHGLKIGRLRKFSRGELENFVDRLGREAGKNEWHHLDVMLMS